MYVVRSHLIEFGGSGHESVALLVGRIRVVEGVDVRWLSRALESGEILKRPLPPKLLWVETEDQLLACKNFGQTSLNEIKKKLADLGLTLRG